MNGTIKREDYQNLITEDVCEKTNFSGYSMATVAGGVLLCIGIIIYAVLTH